MLHYQFDAKVVNPQQIGWQWFETKGRHWLTYWNGGQTVDFYGPFNP